MAKKSSRRMPTTRYHCHGYTIDLVPSNPDNRKWKVYRDGLSPIAYTATVGAAIRAIKKNRGVIHA